MAEDDTYVPSEKLARMAEADMLRAISMSRMFDLIFTAGHRPVSNVVHLGAAQIDDGDREYVAAQFDEIVDLIEILPRTVRIYLRREMPAAHVASLKEIAGLLAAMGATYAPTPKDRA